MVLYFAYVSYLAYQEGSYDPTLLFSVFYLPLLFTSFLFVFDLIFDKIWPSREQKTDDEFNSFLKQVTFEVNEELNLGIEDFRRLRESEKFQKALYQAYQIKLIGETENINFKFLERKFKKNTNEYNALSVVIKEVKKMMVN